MFYLPFRRQRAVRRGGLRALLRAIAADSSKFGGRALIRVCDLDPRYVYVTDGGVSKEIAQEFAEKNCNLITGE